MQSILLHYGHVFTPGYVYNNPGTNGSNTGGTGGGGLLIIYADKLNNKNRITSLGATQKGGGSINIFCNELINRGTMDAKGGTGGGDGYVTIGKEILYTNALIYMYGTRETVNKLFDKNNNVNETVQQITSSNLPNNLVIFKNWCEEEVYFQTEKEEAISASKVTILSSPNTRGSEPIKGFYITASNTEDFSNQIEIYRGEHSMTNEVNNIVTSVHQFTPKGSYKYYRIYVTSWWPFNESNGQNIYGCYIE